MKTFFKKHKTQIVYLALILMVATGTVFGTLAYLRAGTGTISNKFAIAEVTTKIEEEVSVSNPKQIIYKNPTVKNTDKSKTPCIVRMRVLVSPEGILPEGAINYNTQEWTYNSEDSFYYYNGVLERDESTEPLFTQITGVINNQGKFNPGMESFEVTVYQEAVQAEYWDINLDSKETAPLYSAETPNEDGTYQYNETGAMDIWKAYETSVAPPILN